MPTEPSATSLSSGLSEAEAARRLAAQGPNAIAETHVKPYVKFLSFFWGPIPWMIEIAAALSAAVRHWEDFAIIVIMLLINAGVGFWEEFKADNAIAALKKTLALKARVLRDGAWRGIEARDLVPGDVVLLRLGNIVPADVALVEGEYLSVDQSALTGESLPVDKAVGDTAYASSIAKMGEMKAVVTATGAETYFGRTAKLVENAGTTSHFQQAVLRIGNFLILSTLGLVTLIIMVALFRHDPLVDTVLFALILTVAAIPVALPAVLSVTMAVGAIKLARMKAIAARLVSIEEMAGMDVLCSDKTGTLTRNQLVVGDPELVAARDADELLLCAALASRDAADDAIDAAVLGALDDRGGRAQRAGYRKIRFSPFDPVRKRSEAEIEFDGGRFHVTKGAPQVILELAKLDESARREIDATIDSLAAKGYRTLGVARRETDGPWRFLGLVPLFDPPRDDSVETIAQAKAMGLEVRMVTGDNTAIAREIARKLHLGSNIVPAREIFDADGRRHDGDRIERAEGFAEVFPEHKFKIVRELQSRGHIVGMTGDGVNDAPALKQADVGIAVSGATDAARAAADLVLTDSGLSVIARAIEEARKIFERMTSYAVFRIAETIRVLLFMTLSILVFNFYPVTAIMIVLLAILNDFPIMMIAYDNAPVADRPVRWDMHRVLTLSIVLGVMGVISTFGLFWIGEEYLHLSREVIQTLIFLKLLVAGHLTIYLTRNTGAFWARPWPDWRLIVTTEATQILGTLAAVYGWYVTPIGWEYALAVWGYALIWFLINNIVKVYVYRLIRHQARRDARHIGRIGAWLHPHGGPGK
jgi:H+-transporting ATPase